MIRLFLFAAVMCIGHQLDAQSIKKRDVPVAVKSTVTKLYPAASKIEWSKEDSLYEASFVWEDTETELLLSTDGALLMTETDIDLSAVPAAIADFVKRNRHAVDIGEASIRTDAYGGVTYEIEIDNTEYLFTEEGEVLSKESDEDEKE